MDIISSLSFLSFSFLLVSSSSFLAPLAGSLSTGPSSFFLTSTTTSLTSSNFISSSLIASSPTPISDEAATSLTASEEETAAAAWTFSIFFFCSASSSFFLSSSFFFYSSLIKPFIFDVNAKSLSMVAPWSIFLSAWQSMPLHSLKMEACASTSSR